MKLSQLQEQALNLMQALVCYISPNFRMIWIEQKETSFDINIILAEQDEDDVEEIYDLEAEFDALQVTFVERTFNVIVTNKQLPEPADNNSIVVFRKLEE
ncbi:hypothetical protein [Emcibacter sp.]|uniref:hypothetical protein n=1 Tax=Emcibacter sp. TaxID=1979954 RepID=UPI002AA74DF7|nr:hypothetical protein [Emcibacter sp.]